jgi:virginiamycin B lyase
MTGHVHSPTCYGLYLAIGFSLTSHAATITGEVKGPANAGLKGAFVTAQDTHTRITVAVLTDEAGHYRIENLPAGNYQLSIRSVGYRLEPAMSVTVTSDGHESRELALRKDAVRWSDISIYQGKELFPEGKGSDLLFGNCTGCHAFQNEMATATNDADGWKKRVEYERTTYEFGLGQLTGQDVEELSSYLGRLFGPHSVLDTSPADMLGEDRHAGYQDTVRSFSSDSLNIVYVEYDVPPPGAFPFSATPDATGSIWIPNGGAANKITRLQPQPGVLQDFPAPTAGTASVGSLVAAPDGSIWLAEQGPNGLGRWDPDSHRIVEYPDDSAIKGGTKNTVRIDASGNIWSGGVPLTRFDPKSRRFTRVTKVPAAYDLELDTEGNAWFTDPVMNRIGRVDGKTLAVSQWELPTPDAGPRRLQIAHDGMIWIAEVNAGKLARFEPKTHAFKEFVLPSPEPSPWALAFDNDGYLWYSSYDTDSIGRFDTHTGKAIRYPFPHSEITVHEFCRDATGKIWYASAANKKVGYFFLPDSK